jgi:hypothetical protein
MSRSGWVICLLLAAVTCVRADEINGLNSRAVDISVGFFSDRNQHSATFASLDAAGRPTGIVVQSRYTDFSSTMAVVCTITLPLPPSARQVSHPALTTSGWLFVSANANADPGASDGWTLYARPQYLSRSQCDGWQTEWINLGHFPGRPVASAPDAVVAYNDFTYVFVTDRDGRIDYRMFDGNSALRRNPRREWSPWRTLEATNPNVARERLAFSKPAAAVYIEHNIPRLHVFWHDSTHRRINHVTGIISIVGLIREETIDSREFRDQDSTAVAATACTAGPEVGGATPLLLVCGYTAPSGTINYSIAHYRRPRGDWGTDGASVAWQSRSAYGGFSAPSLGRTNLSASSIPLMFVTFAERYCPEVMPAGPGVPAPLADSCTTSGPWVVQNRYSTLSGFERRMYQSPRRASLLY